MTASHHSNYESFSHCFYPHSGGSHPSPTRAVAFGWQCAGRAAATLRWRRTWRRGRRWWEPISLPAVKLTRGPPPTDLGSALHVAARLTGQPCAVGGHSNPRPSRIRVLPRESSARRIGATVGNTTTDLISKIHEI